MLLHEQLEHKGSVWRDWFAKNNLNFSSVQKIPLDSYSFSTITDICFIKALLMREVLSLLLYHL